MTEITKAVYNLTVTGLRIWGNIYWSFSFATFYSGGCLIGHQNTGFEFSIVLILTVILLPLAPRHILNIVQTPPRGGLTFSFTDRHASEYVPCMTKDSKGLLVYSHRHIRSEWWHLTDEQIKAGGWSTGGIEVQQVGLKAKVKTLNTLMAHSAQAWFVPCDHGSRFCYRENLPSRPIESTVCDSFCIMLLSISLHS